MDDRQRFSERCRQQTRTAAQLGSPLYSHLCAHIAEDVAAGGPCWDVVERYGDLPNTEAVQLRFLAAVHRLVLEGRAPALAAHYPSVGGRVDLERVWEPFLAVVREHTAELVDLTAQPCQTNEVGRSAALAAGHLWVARRWRLPLRCLEVGASAGLNLRWDHFRYRGGGSSWGPADSPCVIDQWDVPPPLADVEVVERRGCDPRPLDATSDEGRLRLRSAVWPDMATRHAQLEGALEIAARVPAPVDAEGVGTWLARQLADERPGLATIVYHSVVWRYVPTAERAVAHHALHAAGDRASGGRPLAYLRLEPTDPSQPYSGEPYPLTITAYPGGEQLVLGHAQAHGQGFRWAGSR